MPASNTIAGGTSDLSGGFNLPTKILDNDLLSPYYQASDCFVGQKFSSLLQAYLVDYVISISGDQAVYS